MIKGKSSTKMVNVSNPLPNHFSWFCIPWTANPASEWTKMAITGFFGVIIPLLTALLLAENGQKKLGFLWAALC